MNFLHFIIIIITITICIICGNIQILYTTLNVIACESEMTKMKWFICQSINISHNITSLWLTVFCVTFPCTSCSRRAVLPTPFMPQTTTLVVLPIFQNHSDLLFASCQQTSNLQFAHIVTRFSTYFFRQMLGSHCIGFSCRVIVNNNDNNKQSLLICQRNYASEAQASTYAHT